jgi:hypothetical protein
MGDSRLKLGCVRLEGVWNRPIRFLGSSAYMFHAPDLLGRRNVQADNNPEVQQDRQERIDEVVADHDPGWLESFKPGSFGCHELLDRTSIVVNIVDEYLLSYPACVQNREWLALARQAFDALAKLYQCVGAVHLDE